MFRLAQTSLARFARLRAVPGRRVHPLEPGATRESRPLDLPASSAISPVPIPRPIPGPVQTLLRPEGSLSAASFGRAGSHPVRSTSVDPTSPTPPRDAAGDALAGLGAALFAQSPLSMVIYDPQGHPLAVNPA